MHKSMMVACLAVAGSLLSAPGFAKDTAKEMKASLKEACAADKQKLCSDVKSGEGRILECLDSKSDQLSPNCKSKLSDTRAEISKKIDKADVAFRKECGQDVQKHCADVPSGRGRLLSCLKAHEDDLSQSCKSFQAKIQERVAKFMG